MAAVPDLQVQATRPLGNGSAAVCDGAAPIFGGVPAIDPPRLEDPDAIADALNDFGCRFIDGAGAARRATCGSASAAYASRPASSAARPATRTELQFCAPVPMPLAFASGDTLVTARVRDQAGNLGAPAQLHRPRHAAVNAAPWRRRYGTTRASVRASFGTNVGRSRRWIVGGHAAIVLAQADVEELARRAHHLERVLDAHHEVVLRLGCRRRSSPPRAALIAVLTRLHTCGVIAAAQRAMWRELAGARASRARQ